MESFFLVAPVNNERQYHLIYSYGNKNNSVSHGVKSNLQPQCRFEPCSERDCLQNRLEGFCRHKKSNCVNLNKRCQGNMQESFFSHQQNLLRRPLLKSHFRTFQKKIKLRKYTRTVFQGYDFYYLSSFCFLRKILSFF